MRYLLFIFVAALLVAGCNSNPQASGHPGNAAERGSESATNINPGGNEQPQRNMPGGVGLSGGQSGTGTTSGASTGY